ncbi:MAG TPA: SRPBCC family protein [Longimicrobium sp.]|nr:SRPBCC family protein [Longimicrobium sp.]
MSTAHPLPTLPLAWYFDPAILEIERRTVFADAPEYVGCAPMVPQPGCYYTVPRSDHADALVRDDGKVRLLSNVCLHRNLLMLQGSGRVKALVCPMHRWSYLLDGRVLAAPHYEETPCVSLPQRPLEEWNGIFFTGARGVAEHLAPLSGRPELDVSGYVFVESEIEEQSINWKVPVEVLLENYHVPVIHPGLTRYVDRSTWFGNDGGYDDERLMYQEMKPHPDFAHNPASPVFERWQQAILQVTGGTLPPFAALIALLAPNIFLEWYPFMFVVTAYTARTPEQTLMTREFFYDPRALEAVPRFAELAKAAWDENQQADEIVHAGLHRGRALHYRREPDGLSGYGTYQSPTEDSVQLFHNHLMKRVMPHLRGAATRAELQPAGAQAHSRGSTREATASL